MPTTTRRGARRSHVKSRTGCGTCKRRHLRCDEAFPQCGKCTTHNVRCPYNDSKLSDADRTNADEPDLLWTPEIRAAINRWQRTGVFPFPFLEAHVPPMSRLYSVEELRLIYHIATLYHRLVHTGQFALWVSNIPTLLTIGATTPYVMHALLALSATHIGLYNNCPRVGGMALKHSSAAISGLCDAISSFSRDTSDAILAAALVLSWQATDSSIRESHVRGACTIIEIMYRWRNQSRFCAFLPHDNTKPDISFPLLNHPHLEPLRVEESLLEWDCVNEACDCWIKMTRTETKGAIGTYVKKGRPTQ